MTKLIIILFLSIFTVSCSSLRLKYGFNLRNKTNITLTALHYENGAIKMSKTEKDISKRGVMDGNTYFKIRIKWYYEDGKIRADTLKEGISSTWGYLNMKGVYKKYSKNGEVIKCKIRKHQSNW